MATAIQTSHRRSNSSLASTSPSSRRPTVKSTTPSYLSSAAGAAIVASRPSSSRSVGPSHFPSSLSLTLSLAHLSLHFPPEKWHRLAIASFHSLPKARLSKANDPQPIVFLSPSTIQRIDFKRRTTHTACICACVRVCWDLP